MIMKKMNGLSLGWFGLAAALIFVMSSASCNREDPEPKAGKGGNAVLHIVPRHHAKIIDSCLVFIKYNAQDLPSEFDDSVWCKPVNGMSTATFTGLSKGQYYIFGRGYDEDIDQICIGGGPYTIEEEGELHYNLAITEEH